MLKAYWTEPEPLKMGYPSGPGGLANVIRAFAFVLIVIALTTMFGVTDFHGGVWLFVAPALLAGALFFLAQPAGERHYRHQWKKAFLANNQDIRLNASAMEKVLVHLDKHTSYSADFKRVASSLGSSLRKEDYLNQNNHTDFSWDVLHAYLHFATGEVELQVPYRYGAV